MAAVKPVSPPELAALEHAFATDPSSGAWRPLAEAYLAAGRHMEAMVVSKRGARAYPGDPAPRVLLARVHAAQGREHKALEELGAALAAAPEDVPAQRMAGLLRLQLGEREQGEAALRRAWELSPRDPETLEALRLSGLDFTPPPPPIPPAPPASGASGGGPVPGASPAGAAAPASTATGSLSSSPAPVLNRVGVPAAAVAQQATAEEPVESIEPLVLGGSPAARPAAPSAGAQPAARNLAYAEELAARYATREYGLAPAQGGRARPPRRSRAALVSTAAVGALLVAVLVAWGTVSSVRKARAVEIEKLLRQARELIDKDAHASYREAAALCEKVLERDPDALGGHAYLAYVDAVRFVEHGESEGLRDEARKHLTAVERLGKAHSHAFAAQAYLDFQAGQGNKAVDGLRQVLSGPESASSLLHGVLGALEMRAGDLDAAQQDLTHARQIAPGDVRVAQLLAEHWRRRGAGYELQAHTLYDIALTRLAPDHVPSLLGKAQLLLEGGKAEEAGKRVQRVVELGAASPRQVALATALRGAVLHARGQAAEGDREELKALTLDPTSAELHDLIGRRKLRGDDAAGAVEAFQKATQLEPARTGFFVDLASALMQRPGAAREAVETLERASERAGSARVTKLLGDAYRTAGDTDRAREAYGRALGMEPRFTEARIAIARMYRQARDFPRALEELERAVKDAGPGNPGAAVAQVEIAETEEARGGTPEAVEKAYVAALEADPHSCPALFWLGRSRSSKKSTGYDRAFATETLEAFLKGCPSGPHGAEARELLAGLR